MHDVSIEELTEDQREEILELLVAAYLNTPLHVAVFSEDEDVRRERVRNLFCMGFAEGLKGTWLCARKGATVVGVLHYSRSPDCSLGPEAQEELGAAIKEHFGKAGGLVTEWLRKWAEVHPHEEHWHLGPIAVHPKHQRQGVGGLLMDYFCGWLDRASVSGYLETDVPENVPYYAKFGFTVIKKAQVVGVANWFMKRQAAT